MGTSSSQRASAQSRGTSVVTSLALVVLGGGWCLVGPRPVGPAIGDAVRVVVAMANMGSWALENPVLMVWGSGYATEVYLVRCG